MGFAKDVSEAVDSGQGIVIGIIVIAVTVSIGIYIVTQLNANSNGTLKQAVDMVTGVVGVIGGALNFLALAFLVLVAAIIIRILQSITRK